MNVHQLIECRYICIVQDSIFCNITRAQAKKLLDPETTQCGKAYTPQCLNYLFLGAYDGRTSCWHLFFSCTLRGAPMGNRGNP